MNDLVSIFNFTLDGLSQVWALYTGSILLAMPIALWLLRKVINFFRYIM